MNIGQVTFTYKPIVGGGDVYADMLFGLFGSAGHSQHVYQRQTSASDEALRFVPNPLARLGLGKGEFWTQGLFLPSIKQELLSEDVLIVHYPNYVLKILQMRPGSRPAVVGLSHGVTWDDKPGSFRSRVKRNIARKAFQEADAFVANDTFYLREMGIDAPPGESLFREIAKNRWFIPNCVPPDFHLGNARAKIKALRPVIVPRNLYRNRGIHMALEAFAIFAQRWPEVKLLLVGKESQPAYAAELRLQTARLNLDDRVIFAGHVSHEEMADYYVSCECCLIPSICGEGTSLAALEAMANGLATVSTDAAGLKDLPTVHSEISAESLASRLLEVYPERERIGKEQQALVRSDYSYEKWSNAWLEVINRFAIG